MNNSMAQFMNMIFLILLILIVSLDGRAAIKRIAPGDSLDYVSGGASRFKIDSSGIITIPGLTPDTVPYSGVSGSFTSSLITPTELNYLTGVTSAIQGQLDAVSGAVSGSAAQALDNLTATSINEDLIPQASKNLGSIGNPWELGHISDVQATSISATSVLAASISAGIAYTSASNTDKLTVSSTSDSSTPCPSMSEAQRDLIATPSTGSCIYNADSLTLNVYDGADWKPVGTATGGGGLDIYSQDDFEEVDLLTYTSGSSSTFLDGAATALDGTLSIETVSPISKAASVKYVAGASSLNDFFALPVITLDEKQKSLDSGIVLTFTWDGTSAIEVVIYDVTNSKKLNSSLDVVKNKGSPTRYSASFLPTNSTAQIRVGFHFLEAPTAGNALIYDDLELSTNPFTYKNLTEFQYGTLSQAGSSFLNLDAPQFDLAGFISIGAAIVVVENGVSTQLRALRPCVVTMLFSAVQANPNIQVNGVTIARATNSGGGANDSTAITGRYKLNTGDVMSVLIGSTDIANNAEQNTFTFMAEAETENAITPAKSSVTITKLLTAPVSAVGDISDWQFDNLVIGDWYELGGEWHPDLGANSHRTEYRSAAGGGGTLYGHSVATGPIEAAFGVSVKFQAVSETMYARSTVTSGNLNGNNTKSQSFLQLTNLTAQFLAAIPIQKVDIIEHFGGGSNQVLSTSPTTLNFNTNTNPSFSSLALNQITVPAGEYVFDWSLLFYHIGSNAATYHYLYNVTDSIEVKRGLAAFINGTNGYLNPSGKAHVTFTKSTVLEMRGVISGASGTMAFGDPGTAPNDLHGTIKITKLR